MSNKLCLAPFILFTLLVTAAPSDSFAGKKKKEATQKFTITGNIEGMPEQTVTLEHLKANDSITTVDTQHSDAAGRFMFSGSIPEPGLYRIHFIQDRFLLLSLDKGDVKVTSKWPMDDYKIEGSAASVELKAFIDVAKPLLISMNESQRKLGAVKANGNQGVISDAEKEYDNNKNTFGTYVKHYCDTTPYQPNAILAANIFNVRDELPFMEHFAASMQRRFPETNMTKDYEVFLAKLKESMPQSTEIGDKAPDLSLFDTTGKTVTLSSLKGKFVLLDFWASWCGPCRAENPNVVAAYNKYKNKNFTILSVSLDSKKDAWEKAIDHDMLEWTQVSDLKGWQSMAAGKYSVKAIPTNFLIDPKGVIIAHGLRGPELESKLAEVLK